MYDVILVTDRNYGLYGAFALGILGLKVLVLEYNSIKKNKKNLNLIEEKIWLYETKEDYLIPLEKLNISVVQINNLLVYFDDINKKFIIKYFIIDKIYEIHSTYIVYALSSDHTLIPDQYLTYDLNNNINFEYKAHSFIFGPKAIYDNKTFFPDIFTGEANILAQNLYNKIHSKNISISIHSTDL